MDFLPGGYGFYNLVFWPGIVLVMGAANLVAIIVTVGLKLLILEALGKI